jgi:hypothetical protein
MSKLQEKPAALKRKHPALQKKEFINCFLCLWFIFALLDPDCESGYGSRNPIEFGSTALVCKKTLISIKETSAGNTYFEYRNLRNYKP